MNTGTFAPTPAERFEINRSGVKMDILPRCKGPRCGGKGRILGKRFTRPWNMDCHRCGFPNGYER